MASTRFYVCSGLFCFGFWMLFGFLIGSICVVDLLYQGLVLDNSSVQIRTNRVYQPGRYMLGVKKEFILFPKIQQILIFSDGLRAEKENRPGAKFEEDAKFFSTLKGRSREGLDVSFDLVIYFKVGLPSSPVPMAEQLNRIYTEFGTEWLDIVKRITTFELRNVASEINVLDYFQRRREFGDDLRDALRASLSEFYFELKDVSVINIKIPKDLETAITETEIVKQQVLTLNYTKQAKQIEADTRILEAQKDALITLENANAAGNLTLINKQAVANATTTMLTKQKEAFEQVATNLGLTTAVPDKLLAFYWIYIQRFNNVPQNSLNIGIPTAINA